MAQIRVQDDRVVLDLTPAEKLEGIHASPHAALGAITAIEVLEDAHAEADRVGFKIGTRIPGVIEVASVHGRRRRFFAAVHRDTPRGIRVAFEDGGFDEWIVGCADPEAVAGQLRSALGQR